MKTNLIIIALAVFIFSCNNDSKEPVPKTDSGNTDTPTVNQPSSAPVQKATAVQLSPTLEGSWELDYITGPRIAFKGLYPDKKPVLVFAEAGKVSGNTSCNSLSGSYTQDQYDIKFGEMITTKMACSGQGESVFLSTLKKIHKFDRTNDSTLTLIMGDIAKMRFRKIK